MKDSIFKNVAILAYLTEKISEKYPKNQIGKTVIQKMIYLLERSGMGDFDYTLYHYGPFSSQVASEIDFAKQVGALNIQWGNDKGYFIHTNDTSWYSFLEEKEKRNIEKLVEKFGKFNAKELSIIATAFYVKDNFNVSEMEKIINLVISLKPQYDKNRIREILNEYLKE